MKLAVVGAGMTGCAAALLARRLGAEVTLLESSEFLGGVLRDVEVDGRRYFNNCQYLRPDSVQALGLDGSVVTFDHEYGSLTALGNAAPRLLDDCAQPALDGLVELDTAAPAPTNALERLRAYGHHAQPLIDWASSFGDLNALDPSCTVAMQVSRVYFPQDPALQRKKSECTLADQLIALPRRLRQPGSRAEPAMLPRAGFTALFDDIGSRLKDCGIACITGATVRPGDKSSATCLRIGDQSMNFDWVVWAANPTGLMKRLLGFSLRTPPIAMRLIVGSLVPTEPWTLPVPLPYYWQVFDQNSPFVRVYMYQLEGEVRFSVEAFDHGAPATVQALADLFAQLGLPTHLTIAAQIKQQRYINFSAQELAFMKAATPALMAERVVPGGWCYYGRSEKIHAMSELLHEVLQ